MPKARTVAARAATAAEAPVAQTLRRGLAVLRLLMRAGPAGLRVSEIGRRLDLNKATAVRLTRTLLDEQFVAHDPLTRTYRLGPEAFAVGLAAEPSYALQRRAAPLLHTLARESGEWVFFSVPHGYEAICLSREEGDVPLPAPALKAGDRVPLGVGAGGLAMLATMPDTEVDAALAHHAKDIDAQYPRCNVAVIRRLLAETRDQGWSLIPGLIVPGYWALGVAVMGDRGRCEAAVSLVAAAPRLRVARRAALAQRLLSVARDLAVPPAASVGA